jgi:hypothetical protein
LAAEISLIRARWFILKTYSSILNLIVAYQHDCWLSRWLFGWSGFKRPLEKTIAGFCPKSHRTLLAGSSCVLPHRQCAFSVPPLVSVCLVDLFISVRVICIML